MRRVPVNSKHLASFLSIMFENAPNPLEYAELFVLNAIPELIAVPDEPDAVEENDEPEDGGKKKKGKKKVRSDCQILHRNKEDITTQAKKPEHVIASQSFPTLTKTTFLVYYRQTLDCLVSGITASCTHSSGISISGEVDDVAPDRLLAIVNEQITIMLSLSKLFSTLIRHTQDPRLRTNFVILATLKAGRKYIGEVLRVCFPAIEQHFRNFSPRIVELFKGWQTSSRFLSNLCAHAKQANTSLATQAPQLKRLLETFVFKTKAILTANGCAEAFTLGHMKTKAVI